MSDLNYIECASVRVPANWSLDMLQKTLKKRKIRFHNEEDILAVFGTAIKLKKDLELAVQDLRKELISLQDSKRILEAYLKTPKPLNNTKPPAPKAKK